MLDFFLFYLILNQVPRGGATLLIFFQNNMLSNAAWGKASSICTHWAKKEIQIPVQKACNALAWRHKSEGCVLKYQHWQRIFLIKSVLNCICTIILLRNLNIIEVWVVLGITCLLSHMADVPKIQIKSFFKLGYTMVVNFSKAPVIDKKNWIKVQQWPT